MHMLQLFRMIFMDLFLCWYIFMLITWIGNARDQLKTLCFIRRWNLSGGYQPFFNIPIIDTGAYFRKVELLAPIRLVKTRMVMVMMTIWWWQLIILVRAQCPYQYIYHKGVLIDLNIVSILRPQGSKQKMQHWSLCVLSILSLTNIKLL